MEMRSRATVAAALAMAATVALAGCGGGDDDSQSGGTTTITFWNSFTSSDRPAVEALVKKFNNSQSDVRIDMTIQPGDVLAQKLLPAYAAGKGPTLTTLDASQLPEYASKGVFAPVDDAYGSGKLDPGTLPPASLDSTKWKGKQYGVPFSATGTMLYYNKKLFAAAGIASPPTTMDQLATAAVKTTKYVAGDQSKSQYGFVVSDHAGPATWAVLLESMGGGVVSEDGARSTFGDDATISAMNYWTDLIRNKHVSPTGLSGVDADNLFGAGRAAMYINGPWVSTGFKQAGVDFGVVPVPAGSATQTCTAISVNLHLNARASAAQKAAADKFFVFWNSVESQTYWAIHSAYPPNRSDIPASAVAQNPTAAAFTQAKGQRFYLRGLLKATQIDTNVVVPTIQKITQGQGTPASLLPAAAKQIDALLTQ